MWPEARSDPTVARTLRRGRASIAVISCGDGLRRSPVKMRAVLVLALCLQLVSRCSGQNHHNINFLQSRLPKELLHKKMLMLDQDCDGVFCSKSLIAAPIGSKCVCVLPLKVIIDIGVALHRLFAHIAEFKIEVAAGVFLKQSQIKIMAAVSSLRDPRKTRVTLYLVPPDEKFDNMTALLIYERFWQKKVPVQMPIFGDYEVINIHYPGLPSSSSGSSGSGSEQFLSAADVSNGKAQKLGIIIVIAFSSFTLILSCFGIFIFVLKWRKLHEPHISSGPPLTPSRAKTTGADRNKSHLDWDARMRIALGAARGLAYLHEDSNPHVIHRDFKASNILLEEDFTPKVSDFGLARETSQGDHHISTRVMGTFGYVAPEYAMTGHLLIESDVYSYGVVLLELLSGRKPVYMSQSGGPENLVTWARPLLSNREGIEQLIDPFLSGHCNMDHVVKVAAIASLCVHTEPSQRPFMREVVQALKHLYNDMDEGCDDSHIRKESSSDIECDYIGDFDTKNSRIFRDLP